MRKCEEVQYRVNSQYLCNTVAYYDTKIPNKKFINGGSNGGGVRLMSELLNDGGFQKETLSLSEDYLYLITLTNLTLLLWTKNSD